MFFPFFDEILSSTNLFCSQWILQLHLAVLSVICVSASWCFASVDNATVVPVLQTWASVFLEYKPQCRNVNWIFKNSTSLDNWKILLKMFALVYHLFCMSSHYSILLPKLHVLELGKVCQLVGVNCCLIVVWIGISLITKEIGIFLYNSKPFIGMTTYTYYHNCAELLPYFSWFGW